MRSAFLALLVAGALAGSGLANMPVAYAAGTVQSQNDDAVEIEFWQSIKNSTDPAEYRAYLSAFPDGHFAPLARLRLNQLASDPAPQDKPVSQDTTEKDQSSGGSDEQAASGADDPPQDSPQGPSEDSSEDSPEDSVEQETGAIALLPSDLDISIPPADEDRRWIGVNMVNLTPNVARMHGLAHARGVLVTGIIDYAPAAQSPLMVGDVILAVDNVPIRDGAALVEVVGKIQTG
ncbi:MAG: PDZ domain-containing protein, partial [Fimbriimonadaceae bacterium]|nr:PDZ domain-containing protein [Alphaproteobacteria bacterium]